LILRFRTPISIAASAVIAATSAAAAAATRSTALPRWWVSEAMCIHRHESRDWHRETDWLGRPSVDHGGMQIDVTTWKDLAPRGFPGEPAAATPREQLIVAHRIWLVNGRRFGGSQWFLSAARCGVD
jgi:Transglycosylase-like domain